LEITELHNKDEKAWDSYVLKSSTSTFYHQLGWRNVVEKTYKHRSIYLIAKEYMPKKLLFIKEEQIGGSFL